MKTLPRTFVISLCAALALSTLVACSGDTPTSSSGATDTSAAATGQPAESPAASSSWDDVVAAAKQEGAVTVYLASQDGINQRLVEAFEKEYPEIAVTYTRLESGASTARVATEIESGATTADVVQIADNVVLEEHPDWFTSLAGIPNADAWPAERIKDYYVHQQTAPFVITYNTESLPTPPPEKWADLATSDAIKKGVMIDPRVANSFMAMMYFLREQGGDELLKQLGENVGGVADSSATVAQQVAAGEVALAFPNTREHTNVARSQGAPVDTVVGQPSLAVTNIYTLPKAGVNHNAAAVFLNFVLSKEGAESTCLGGDYQSFAYDDLPTCPKAGDNLTLVVDIYPKLNDEVRAEISALLGLE
jgi:iron(III) transport system substrate-binding protein